MAFRSLAASRFILDIAVNSRRLRRHPRRHRRRLRHARVDQSPEPSAPARLTVCPGDAVSLSSNASDPDGPPVDLSMVGQRKLGGKRRSIHLHAELVGRHPNWSACGGLDRCVAAADASPVTIHVNTYSRPTVSVAAKPNRTGSRPDGHACAPLAWVPIAAAR